MIVPLARRRIVAEQLVARLRYLVLPAMTGLFAWYVAMHLPFRTSLPALAGMGIRGGYFVCRDALSASRLADSVAAFALIITATSAALVVADRFDGARYERPLTFSLSALAFVVVPAATIAGIAEWSGTTLLRPPLGPLLTAIPAAGVVGVGLRHTRRPHRLRLDLAQPGLVLIVGGLAVVLLLASTVISLMHPPTAYDALAYHAPLAVFLWHDGNLGTFLDRAPGYWPLANPGTAELWSGLLLLAGGERLADLGQLAFAFVGSAAIGVFARRQNLGKGSALLAACAFLLAPLVVAQIGLQLNDVVGAALLMAAAALAAAPIAHWSRRRHALLGVALGLVATTKLALLPGVAGVALFLVAATIWQYRRAPAARSMLARAATTALAFALVVTPWWARNMARYGNPVYPGSLPVIGRGVEQTDFSSKDAEFVPRRMAWAIYPLLEPHNEYSGFGTLFVVGVIPGLVFAAVRGRREPMLLYLLVAVVMLPAWWIFTRHEPRFLLALCGIGFAFLPWSLLAIPRRQRPIGAALLTAAAIFSALVTLDQLLLPAAGQPSARLEFYDQVWGVDPAVITLPESEALLYNTGYAGSSYPGYYALLGRRRTRMVIAVDTDMSIDSIIRTMHDGDVRYVYVVASPQNRAIVEAMYDQRRFELVHTSTIDTGEQSEITRYLYRLRTF